MNRLIVLVLVATAFSACNQHKNATAVNNDSFTLTGKLTGLGNDTILLAHRTDTGTIYDTAIAKNDSFSFTGKCPQPRVYSLQWWMTAQKKNRAFRILTDIFIENADMSITGNIDSPEDYQLTIKGSATQNTYDEFLALTRPVNAQMDSLETASNKFKPNKEEMKAIDSAYNALVDQKKDIAAKFIAQNPKSPVSSYIALRNLGTESVVLGRLDTLYRLLDTSVQQNYYGKQLHDVIASLKQTEIGMPAPTFTLNDTSGKPISLNAYKGKVVLIDFWASWCGPCRRENPNVVKAYRKYHPKGFEILGVSLDEKHDKWTAAIIKDNLSWQHVSDLKGWNNVVAKQYAVRSIPNNYLIDKDGKIIAKSLYADDLTAKLEEVLR